MRFQKSLLHNVLAVALVGFGAASISIDAVAGNSNSEILLEASGNTEVAAQGGRESSVKPLGAKASEISLIPVASSFDVSGLQALLSQDCETQAATRQKNIRRHYRMSSEFDLVNAPLMVFSPHLRTFQHVRANKLAYSLPQHAISFLYPMGGTFVFTRRGIVEALPVFEGDKDYYSDVGLYLAVQRSVYVPFEKAYNIVVKQGRVSPGYWGDSHRDPARILTHESGHMIDDLLGDFSKSSRGADGDDRLSNRADFMAAYERDLDRLISQQNVVSAKEVHRLGYYLPGSHKGVKLGGIRNDAQRGRREVFAELWAEVHGHRSNNLSQIYTDSFKIVHSINAFLKDQVSQSPQKCVYQPVGSPVTVPNR
jgi:hypothetical protein